MSWARLGWPPKTRARTGLPRLPCLRIRTMRRCGMWFTLPKCFVALDVAHIFCDANDHVGKEVVDVRSTS
jgi:hypothetical protein